MAPSGASMRDARQIITEGRTIKKKKKKRGNLKRKPQGISFFFNRDKNQWGNLKQNPEIIRLLETFVWLFLFSR